MNVKFRTSKQIHNRFLFLLMVLLHSISSISWAESQVETTKRRDRLTLIVQHGSFHKKPAIKKIPLGKHSVTELFKSDFGAKCEVYSTNPTDPRDAYFLCLGMHKEEFAAEIIVDVNCNIYKDSKSVLYFTAKYYGATGHPDTQEFKAYCE